jgi:hypothetical protein
MSVDYRRLPSVFFHLALCPKLYALCIIHHFGLVLALDFC